MTESRIVLIRHGESTWNASGQWQGHGDPPLSEHGRDQVGRLTEQLVEEGIEVIVASDLIRAAETAAILGRALEVVPESDARLRELDVGDWTGLTRREIEERDGAALRRFESDVPGARAGGGESRRALEQRVRPAVSEIAARHAGRRLAVVAHLGVILALLPGVELANAGWCRASASDLDAAASAL